MNPSKKRLKSPSTLSAIIGLSFLLQNGLKADEYYSKVIEHSLVVSSAIYDYNNDGHDDLFVTGHDKQDRIWYWSPQGYVPSGNVLATRWGDRHGCQAADVNNDNLADIYCMNGASLGDRNKENELYLQQPNGSFALKPSAFGAEDPWGRGRLPLFFNFNNDGYPDLYITNYAVPREDGQPNINRVYVNTADNSGSFSEVTTKATGPHGSRCVNKGDWNKDGFDDLVTCNNDNPAWDISPGKLFKNTGQGDFQNVTDIIYRGDALWKDAVLKDMNQDGWDDLILITKNNTLEVRFNQKSGIRFGKVNYSAKMTANPQRIAIGDFNHDAVPDIYIVRSTCINDNSEDIAPDFIYFGPSWTSKIEIPQKNKGCGWGASVVDGDKILLMNGGWHWDGSNELIGDWKAFAKTYELTPLSK